jgi:type I restriction enzyme M protein
MQNNFTEKANFIWSIADLIRDTFKRGRYQEVILPLTVLRRIDAVLEPTKDAVLERYHAYRDKLDNMTDMLRSVSGYAFYNTSPYTFERLLADPNNLADNLRAYIAGFSPNMREVLDNFDFHRTIERLDEAGLLYLVIERFQQLDLHPDVVPNHEMGTIFEELIRRFNEALNENPGEHFTPRDVIALMVRLLIAPDHVPLRQPHIVCTIYDPCCGTGGMLTLAKDAVQALNPQADVYLYGQEVNPETYAVCKSDLYMKDPTGRDAEHIALGSTLAEDHHAGQTFGYQLANPPYGKDWKMDREAVAREADRGHAGRFGAGTPRISDGQLLFLQHMLSHLPPPPAPPPLAGEGGALSSPSLAPPAKEGRAPSRAAFLPSSVGGGGAGGGGRIAIVMNGSPLFTGDAGSGESEIRRWILEHDWLEALVALPEQLFYNTGIATYVWILSNRKSPERRGKVLLIDASELWSPMRKSLGNKRREITPDHIDQVAALYTAFAEDDRAKVFQTTDFGYRKIRVERPVRMNFCPCETRLPRLEDQRAFTNLAKSRKRNPEARAQAIAEGKAKQDAILAMLRAMDPVVYKDVREFRTALKRAAKAHGLKLYAAMRDAIVDALGEPDPDAAIMVDRQGRPVPDSDLRDYERVPLDRAVADYFAEEIAPHVSDAWIDEEYVDEKDGGIGQVGYEINFNRYFYEYEPPRPLEEIEADLRTLQSEIVTMLEELL